MPSSAVKPLERCAIAHAGGHGDDRDANETSDDAGQRAFHAGADDHDAGLRECFAIGQQTMNSRDAHVVEVLDRVAHEFGSNDGLFGDRDVAGSRRYNSDGAFAIGVRIALAAQSLAPVRDILRRALFSLLRQTVFYRRVWRGRCRRASPAAQKSAPLATGSCALRRITSGMPARSTAMMVHLGETKIFKGQMAQAVDGIVGREFALAHLLEQFADGFGVHSGGAALSIGRTIEPAI